MEGITHHYVETAAPPASPYHHAVEAAGWLHVTGQLPTDPKDPKAPLPDDIQAQTKLVFENLRLILEHAGYTFDNVMFLRIYMTHFKRDFHAMNEIIVGHFKKEYLPGRTTFGVAELGRDALVEIDLVAYKKPVD
ncbi:RidA family protein [Thiomicrorhabdus xiamenensis]|uniref:RidA family protein n=1 Tax=Thiomicrorhabdus xiamenensis TaxID=2739063 RepID=A0A7D4TFJ9_9GAMM|nr:RidA family protein [Thiomicrorhabdus xiamenensis]QKI88948.1 RidA family protein [Thiomicrorhabdus xiamenensis]